MSERVPWDAETSESVCADCGGMGLIATRHPTTTQPVGGLIRCTTCQPALKARRKKSTRRWCKGVEGREHQPEMIKQTSPWLPNCNWASAHGLAHDDHTHWLCCHKVRCKACGKVLDDWPKCPELPE